jgi:hypothetical protein
MAVIGDTRLYFWQKKIVVVAECGLAPTQAPISCSLSDKNPPTHNVMHLGW